MKINLQDAIGRGLAVKYDIPATQVDGRRYTYDADGNRVGRLTVRDYRNLCRDNKSARP